MGIDWEIQNDQAHHLPRPFPKYSNLINQYGTIGSIQKWSIFVSDKEIQLYLNRAKEDLRAVEINIQNSLYNVAVSRAYYAMFYAATALLMSKGIERNKHSGIISAFGEHFVRPGLIEVEYAKLIAHAFDSRNDGDYDVAFVATRALAEAEFKDAAKFVNRIEQYFAQVGE